jgi:hypothetical protein
VIDPATVAGGDWDLAYNSYVGVFLRNCSKMISCFMVKDGETGGASGKRGEKYLDPRGKPL